MRHKIITTALSFIFISSFQVHGMESIAPPQGILTKLLTLKFPLAGEELVTEVEKLRKESLPTIKKEEILEFLQTQQTHPKTDYKVKVWIEDNADKESLDRSLLAASYFPKPFDIIEDLLQLYDKQCEEYQKFGGAAHPKRHPCIMHGWTGYLHVQKQLAYAAYYGHPDSFKNLKEMTVWIGKGSGNNDSDEESDSSPVMTERFTKTLEEREAANVKYKLINLYFDVNNNKEEKDRLKGADWISRPQAQRDIILNNLLDIVDFGPDHPEPTPLPAVRKIVEQFNWVDADS